MAAGCNTSTNNPGKLVTVGWYPACGDADFKTITYKPFGTVNQKQLQLAAETVSNRNDNSGSTASDIVVSTTVELTVSGFRTNKDGPKSAQDELIKYYIDETQAGRQPTVWIKVAGQGYNLIWHIFMVYKAGGDTFGTDELITGDFNFSITDTGDDTNKSLNLDLVA